MSIYLPLSLYPSICLSIYPPFLSPSLPFAVLNWAVGAVPPQAKIVPPLSRALTLLLLLSVSRSSPGAPQLTQQHQGPPASEAPGGALVLKEPPSPASSEGLQAEVEELLLLQDLYLSGRSGGDDPRPHQDREGDGPSGSKQAESRKGASLSKGSPEQHQEKQQVRGEGGPVRAARSLHKPHRTW